MYLNQVLKSLGKKCPKVEFNGISYDSRNIKRKNIFFAIQGNKTSGLKFLKEVEKKGASAIIFDKKIKLSIPIILFHGSNDKVVPVNFSKKILKIVKKSKKKLIIINKGDHSLSRKKDLSKICKELKNIVEKFKYD